MSAPPVVKKSPLSQTQQDNIRKSHIKSRHFDPAWIGEGGPIDIYQSCGFVSNTFRDNYDDIKWD